LIGTAIQGLEIILESCVFLVFNLCEIVLLAIEEEEEEKEGQLWLKMVARDPINRTCPCNSLVRDGFDFFYVHQDFWPSSRGKVFLSLSPGSSLNMHACYSRGVLPVY
jgi:hypothetical protein